MHVLDFTTFECLQSIFTNPLSIAIYIYIPLLPQAEQKTEEIRSLSKVRNAERMTMNGVHLNIYNTFQ